MAVFDLHVHTVRGSSDSSLTPEQLINHAVRLKLDGLCLTEHGGGWTGPDLERTFDGSGLIIVQGLEVETDMGHILVLGLHSYVSGMNTATELRKEVDKAGGVMISAHPFRNLFNPPPYDVNLVFRNRNSFPATGQEAADHPLFGLVDDVEVANGSNTRRENLFCMDVANHLGLKGTGGSDAHSTHGLGRCVTVFDGEITSEADLIEALKAKAFEPGEGANLGRPQPFPGPSA